MLILDSGALSRLSERSSLAAAVIAALRHAGVWPPVVPTVIVAESTAGLARTDAGIDRLLRSCDVVSVISEARARRAGVLRRLAGRGSVVDAIVVALGEPGGTVLTADPDDLKALAAHAADVTVEVV